MKRIVLPLIAAAVVACDTIPLEPPPQPLFGAEPELGGGYVAVDLGTLPGHGFTIAFGINNNGVVVGQSAGVPFRWTRHGGMEQLAGFDGPRGAAMAINNKGAIAGWTIEGSRQRATRWDVAGQPYLLEMPALSYHSEARGINDNGDIIGTAFEVTGLYWPAAGGLVRVCPQHLEVDLIDVNNRGQVVGQRWGAWPTGWYLYRGIVWSLENPSCDAVVVGGVVAGSIRGLNQRGDIAIAVGALGAYDPAAPEGIRIDGGFGSYRITHRGVAERIPFIPWTINGRGDVIGHAHDESYIFTQGGELIWLGRGSARSINDSGDVVGHRDGRAVLWTRQPTRLIGVPNVAD
jgi:hypothetical protein